VNYLAALSLTWAGIYGGVVRKEEVSDIFPPAVCIYVAFFYWPRDLFKITLEVLQSYVVLSVTVSSV
jgi:hypothetical protein